MFWKFFALLSVFSQVPWVHADLSGGEIQIQIDVLDQESGPLAIEVYIGSDTSPSKVELASRLMKALGAQGVTAKLVSHSVNQCDSVNCIGVMIQDKVQSKIVGDLLKGEGIDHVSRIQPWVVPEAPKQTRAMTSLELLNELLDRVSGTPTQGAPVQRSLIQSVLGSSQGDPREQELRAELLDRFGGAAPSQLTRHGLMILSGKVLVRGDTKDGETKIQVEGLMQHLDEVACLSPLEPKP